MKLNRTFVIRLVLVLALATIAGISAAQEPDQSNTVGTEITYQGRLEKSDVPVDDTCDMTFRLYDRETNGSQAGVTVTDSVAVSDGLFTASLDFGAGAFDGKARWLEIDVQCTGDAAATTLPRVSLTAAPYAHYALTAPWNGIDNMPSGFADNIDDDTQYRAGWGLRQEETAFSVDERLVQVRVTDPCGSAEAIQQINQNGTVECESVQSPLTAIDPLELDETTNELSLNQGAGSGLDADTLDAKDSTEYLILAEDQTVTGSPTFDNTTPFSVTNATLIPNLNAEWLGGKNTTQYFRLDAGEVVSAENKTTFLGQVDFTSSPAFNANPPFSVGGPNKVADLNTDLLDGLDSTEYFQLDKNGQVVSGTTTFEGGITFNSRPAFSGDDSAAPFTVVSTETVTGLNADMLDGKHASELTTNDTLDDYFYLQGDNTIASGTTNTFEGTSIFNEDATFNADSTVIYNSRPQFNGGTSGSDSPFTVDSNYRVTALNADQVDGYDAGNADGNIPISNGTRNINLNADLLDGQHASDFVDSSTLDDYFLLAGPATVTGIPAFNGGTTGSSSPFTVDSNYVVTNLNADQVDGYDASDLARSGSSRVTSEASVILNDSTYSGTDPTGVSQSQGFCFLVHVEFNGIDEDGEAYCKVVLSGGSWQVEAGHGDSGNDASVVCKARCYQW
jgi:hypothetical protein